MEVIECQPAAGPSRRPKVAIIGGGVTGLAAAFYLQTPADVHLYEQSSRFGGKILTVREDGFIVEAGPDAFLDQKPWARQFCHDLGLSSELIATSANNARVYVWCDNRFIALPEGMMLLAPARWLAFARSPLFSLPGRLRFTAEWLMPAGPPTPDESLDSFVRRRFGKEALELLGEPLMAGIFMSDPKVLSMQSTFPQLLEMEQRHRSVLRGMRRRRRARTGTLFLSLKNGMGRLVEQCLSRLQVSLHPATRVESLDCQSGCLQIRSGEASERFDAVIVATAAAEAATILRHIAPESSRRLGQIDSVSSAVVSLAFRQTDVGRNLDAHGVILPSRDNRKITSMTWTSSKFAGRAPDGFVLLRTFAGGYRNPHIDNQTDQELLEASLQETRSILGISGNPVRRWIFRWPGGNPVYRVGHKQLIEQIERDLPPGVLLAGSPYRGVGIPDCIRQGMEAATRIKDKR